MSRGAKIFNLSKNMMFGLISDLWNKWNIRSFVILSLSLQVFLILFAPLRKKTANHYIISLLWLAYLMADWVAAFTIGLISHNQVNLSVHPAEVDGALEAFWASFLLLHLGGPDTITAFSLEDSSLWQRHLLNLIFQVGAAIYVFAQIFPNDKSLLIPTILVFLAGVIKNVERTVALNLSSLSRLRESMLQQLECFDDKYFSPIEQFIHERFIHERFIHEAASYHGETELAESTVVNHAFYFFQIFKVFFGDLMVTSQQRSLSMNYFASVSPLDALRVISVELHFMYEVLHTKALTIRSKWSYLFRFIAFIEVVMALVLFNRLKKHQLPEPDMKITYSLLFGGITLDVIALFMLVFSDWTIVGIKRYDMHSSKLHSFLRLFRHKFLHKLISATDVLRIPRFTRYVAKNHTDVTYVVLDTPFIFRRWSESISACNLFSESLKESPTKMYKHNRHWGIIAFSNICSFPHHMAEILNSGLHQAGETISRCCGFRSTKRFIANAKYMSKNPFINDLWIFIFREVRDKSCLADNPEEVRKIFEARGDMFLQRGIEGINFSDILNYISNDNISNITYDSSIITWHVATEILYNMEQPSICLTDEKKEFSKILSDYMLYLLLNQPQLMSAVAVAGIAQMKSAEMLDKIRHLLNDAPRDLEKFCKKFFHDEGHEEGDDYLKSPLGNGFRLAQEMEKLEERKWEVMSGVWVEMLSYAAIHIKGEAHVQVLSKGGELLAYVWLLMVHFGCFYKHEWGMSYDYKVLKHSPRPDIINPDLVQQY